MKKVFRLLACILILASVFCLSTYAATWVNLVLPNVSDPGKDSGGTGLLKCFDSPDYKTYAETVANSSGSGYFDFIYVYVLFDEYNPELSREVGRYHDQGSYTTAYVFDYGFNPDRVSSEHGIRRGDDVYYGEALIDYT